MKKIYEKTFIGIKYFDDTDVLTLSNPGDDFGQDKFDDNWLGD